MHTSYRPHCARPRCFGGVSRSSLVARRVPASHLLPRTFNIVKAASEGDTERPDKRGSSSGRSGNSGAGDNENINPSGRSSETENSAARDRDGSLSSSSSGSTSSSSPVRSSSSVPDSLPNMGSDADWREFRARLVHSSRASSGLAAPESATFAKEQLGQAAVTASQRPLGEWAHTLPKPEKGCLLLAHPLMFRDTQQYFYQAVIFLLEHQDSGSYGIILNRPSQYTIAQLPLSKPLEEFSNCRLLLGGDVGPGEVHVLHPHGQVKDSIEVVNGVYLGGIESAQEMVRKKELNPLDFKWFTRYAGWGPGQLQRECKNTTWFVAAASPSVILSQVKDKDGLELWHHVLELIGGDHAKLSQSVRATVAEEQRQQEEEEGRAAGPDGEVRPASSKGDDESAGSGAEL